MWQLQGAQQEVAQQIGMHDAPVKCVGFLPTSNIVVSGGWDRKVRVTCCSSHIRCEQSTNAPCSHGLLPIFYLLHSSSFGILVKVPTSRREYWICPNVCTHWTFVAT